MPSREARFDLAAQIIQRIRRVRPRFDPNPPIGRKLFRDHPPVHYIDLARERGVDAALVLLPRGWLSSERVAPKQLDTLPDSADVSRALAEAAEQNEGLPGATLGCEETYGSEYSPSGPSDGGDNDPSDCDDGNLAAFEDRLVVTGTRREELRSPGHWEPIDLVRLISIRWLPARSEWVTPAERELANIACLCQQGLTSREISDKLKLNIRLVQRRINYLLSFQRDAEDFVAKEQNSRT